MNVEERAREVAEREREVEEREREIQEREREVGAGWSWDVSLRCGR